MTRFRRSMLTVAVAAALGCSPVHAQDRFVVEDIEVEGLQRIDAGTVFTYLPVRVGEEFSVEESDEVIEDVFDTGFFRDVQLYRRGNVLVVDVSERPAIARIDISGNKKVETEQLTKSLTDIGLARGRVFDRSVLEKVESELLNVYHALGKYGVRIDTSTEALDRNRVAITIDIAEGLPAKIRTIDLVGNQAFDDDELLDEFQLGIPNPLAFWSKKDQYSRQKLGADLETLRSFYLDRGFLKFNIDSTQVTISPDRKDIFLTINITEGERYEISEVSLAGNMMVPEEELRSLLEIEAGDTFSRKAMTGSTAALKRRLSNEGYAFAEVNAVPQLDEEAKTAKLTFYLDPGKQVYVRNINFRGHYSTNEEVLRREMRQMEQAPYSGEDIDRSKVRLQRLGYIERVNVDTSRVPGTDDQVDVNYDVSERRSGSFTIGAGYSQSQGIILNTSINENNFMGTGKQVSVNFDNSSYRTLYSLSYNNPYYTINGVSRGFSAYYRETDAEEVSISRYSTNSAGGDINFGIPITEYDRVRFGVGGEQIEILAPNDPSAIVGTYGGDTYNQLKLTASWTHDTRNRTVFADEGSMQRVHTEVMAPGSDLEFYKVGYRNKFYFPWTEHLTFSLGGNLDYGEAYGTTPDDKLPFFENYYAGGTKTVRGYEDYSLGPRASEDDPVGGSFRTTGRGELIFPAPFTDAESSSMRLSAFVDIGNVFDGVENFEFDELRQSVGVSFIWLSPVGPLNFSLAKPLNDQPGDETQVFQFNIGTGL